MADRVAPALVSVVVPTLNEAAGIAATLAAVERQPGPVEIIVVDGASEDGTVDVVRDSSAAHVVSSPRGRAAQMNRGAAEATGDILLFLHADTRLPERALETIRTALRNGAVGGCFETAFGDTSRAEFGPAGRAAMRLWQARLWMRWHRLAFGDRALFASRDAFQAVGGFPDQPLFEDLDFVRALRQRGRFVFLDVAVVTSPRRFRRNGAVRQQLRNLALWSGWLVGLSPARLKRFYSDRTGERD